MNTETDLYETDAAYVEAWERWALDNKLRRSILVLMDTPSTPSNTWRIVEPELDL